MKILQSKGNLLELKKNIDLDICESSILGKQKKTQFFKGWQDLKTKKARVGTHGFIGTFFGGISWRFLVLYYFH
jgi:hypothetical protein